MKFPFYPALFIGALLSLSSCYEKERLCTDFKNGRFEFRQEIDGKEEVSHFSRMDSLQIETFRGRTDTSTVRWINDCEFILKKVNPRGRMEQKAIHMKILHTQADGYTFEYGFVGEKSKQSGSVIKLD